VIIFVSTWFNIVTQDIKSTYIRKVLLAPCHLFENQNTIFTALFVPPPPPKKKKYLYEVGAQIGQENKKFIYVMTSLLQSKGLRLNSDSKFL